MSRFATLFALAAVSACAALPAAAAGKVEVKFDKPEQYADAGRSGVDRDRTLKSLTDYMQGLGSRLPDGQTLRLEVLDIDLAGELRWRGTDEIRILRGRADWPHMTLRYTLLGADGSTLSAGQAELSDMNYLFGSHIDDFRYGDLPYEKRMVEQWFAHTFDARTP